MVNVMYFLILTGFVATLWQTYNLSRITTLEAKNTAFMATTFTAFSCITSIVVTIAYISQLCHM
jgi:hypothetical protein